MRKHAFEKDCDHNDRGGRLGRWTINYVARSIEALTLPPREKSNTTHLYTETGESLR